MKFKANLHHTVGKLRENSPNIDNFREVITSLLKLMLAQDGLYLLD